MLFEGGRDPDGGIGRSESSATRLKLRPIFTRAGKNYQKPSLCHEGTARIKTVSDGFFGLTRVWALEDLLQVDAKTKVVSNSP